MLKRIPIYPHRRSTTEIAAYLNEHEHACTARTVQRDLEKLSTDFHFTCEAEGRTNYWFFPREQRVLDIPGMNAGAALALMLAREHALPMIPPATLTLLEPYFNRAEEVLRESLGGALSSWRARVKLIGRGPTLKPPTVRSDVQHEIYESVLNGTQVSVSHRGRGAKAATELTLHPQGLVFRDGVAYLVATAWEYDDVRHYPLHRIIQAQALELPARKMRGFDLAAHVEQAFSYPVSPRTIGLVARFVPSVAIHLEERPLSQDQKVTIGKEWTEIRASVPDTEELRWWLLGFGEHCEVMRPKALRSEMRRRTAALAARYRA